MPRSIWLVLALAGCAADAAPDAGAADALGLLDAAAADAAYQDAAPDAEPADAGLAEAGVQFFDGGAQPASCMIPCQSGEECFGSSGPLYNQDNYQCAGGVCRYKGCNQDVECSASLGAGFRCASLASGPGARCYRDCAVAADCAQSAALYSADHYACTDGHCEHLGCRTDPECAEVKGAGWVCAAVGTSPYPDCVRGCAQPADCAQALPEYGADNFLCQAGRCRWQGCASTAECNQGPIPAGLVCR